MSESSNQKIYEVFSRHKDLYIFELEEYRVLFRILTWAEFNNFAHLFFTCEPLKEVLEDDVWELCVIEHNQPFGYEFFESGIITTVVNLIFQLSGCAFLTDDSIVKANNQLNVARQNAQTINEQLKLTICEAFPAYKPEDLDKLTWTEILDRVAQAEILLKRTFEFKLPQQEDSKPVDDSAKVFRMLDTYSSTHPRKKK